MADNFRATMHFQHSYFGFSETWYMPNSSYTSFLSKLKLMYEARKQPVGATVCDPGHPHRQRGQHAPLPPF